MADTCFRYSGGLRRNAMAGESSETLRKVATVETA